MIGGKPLIYWDTCIWLAWARNEQRPAGDIEGIQEYIDRFEKDQIYICTSVIAEAEMLDHKFGPGQRAKLQKFFDNPQIDKIGVDQTISRLVGELRSHYFNLPDRLPTLTLGDALHLASAIIYDCDEFLTFDENDCTKPSKARRALIPLNGNVAGHKLTICKPVAKAPKLRLVVPQPPTRGKGDDDAKRRGADGKPGS